MYLVAISNRCTLEVSFRFGFLFSSFWITFADSKGSTPCVMVLRVTVESKDVAESYSCNKPNVQMI